MKKLNRFYSLYPPNKGKIRGVDGVTDGWEDPWELFVAGERQNAVFNGIQVLFSINEDFKIMSLEFDIALIIDGPSTSASGILQMEDEGCPSLITTNLEANFLWRNSYREGVMFCTDLATIASCNRLMAETQGFPVYYDFIRTPKIYNIRCSDKKKNIFSFKVNDLDILNKITYHCTTTYPVW